MRTSRLKTLTQLLKKGKNVWPCGKLILTIPVRDKIQKYSVFSFASSSTIFPCQYCVSWWVEFWISVASRLASLLLKVLSTSGNDKNECFIEKNLWKMFCSMRHAEISYMSKFSWGKFIWQYRNIWQLVRLENWWLDLNCIVHVEVIWFKW